MLHIVCAVDFFPRLLSLINNFILILKAKKNKFRARKYGSSNENSSFYIFNHLECSIDTPQQFQIISSFFKWESETLKCIENVRSWKLKHMLKMIVCEWCIPSKKKQKKMYFFGESIAHVHCISSFNWQDMPRKRVCFFGVFITLYKNERLKHEKRKCHNFKHLEI